MFLVNVYHTLFTSIMTGRYKEGRKAIIMIISVRPGQSQRTLMIFLHGPNGLGMCVLRQFVPVKAGPRTEASRNGSYTFSCFLHKPVCVELKISNNRTKMFKVTLKPQDRESII